MNVRNTQLRIIKQKTFLKAYTSVVHERFTWLRGTLLPYFSDWKGFIGSTTYDPYSKIDKARMFIL